MVRLYIRLTRLINRLHRKLKFASFAPGAGLKAYESFLSFRSLCRSRDITRLMCIFSPMHQGILLAPSSCHAALYGCGWPDCSCSPLFSSVQPLCSHLPKDLQHCRLYLLLGPHDHHARVHDLYRQSRPCHQVRQSLLSLYHRDSRGTKCGQARLVDRRKHQAVIRGD
jgi:hypothetical protein